MTTGLYVFASAMLVILVLLGLLVYFARKGAKTGDDLDEAESALRLRKQAEAAAEKERAKLDRR